MRTKEAREKDCPYAKGHRYCIIDECMAWLKRDDENGYCLAFRDNLGREVTDEK